MSKLTKLVPFVDSVGRIIIGRTTGKIAKNANSISVLNPAIVNIQMQEDGQVSVQLIPYMFKEFLLPENQKETVWEFGLNQITYSTDVAVDERITEQYQQVFELTDEERQKLVEKIQSEQSAPVEAETVELFDEAKS